MIIGSDGDVVIFSVWRLYFNMCMKRWHDYEYYHVDNDYNYFVIFGNDAKVGIGLADPFWLVDHVQ